MRLNNRIAAVIAIGWIALSSITWAQSDKAVQLHIPEGWKLAAQESHSGGWHRITLVKANDEAKDPVERLRMLSGPRWKSLKKPEDILEDFKKSSDCPQATQKVIAQDESSITVEMGGAMCPTDPEVEFYKGILARNTVWVVSYRKRTNRLTETERAEWLKFFEGTVLGKAHDAQ
jgi:hypothetical protein